MAAPIIGVKMPGRKRKSNKNRILALVLPDALQFCLPAFHSESLKSKQGQETHSEDFAGGSVIKTPHFHSRGHAIQCNLQNRETHSGYTAGKQTRSPDTM